MSDKQPQSFENHARFVPFYHFVISLILVVNLGWSIWRMIGAVTADTVIAVLVAIALIGLFWYCRIFPLAVQNRVIRLEMRLRLHEVLPDDLRARILELSASQLIALRFAGDAEMTDLVREVLDKKIRDQKEIKKKVKDWQADHLRC